VQTPCGEIDILAARHKTLVVVEVKKRGNDFAAAAAISPHQQQRLIAAANHVLRQYPHYEILRFDAMLFTPKTLPKHLQNAFF
jgi:putative endonuclease